MTKSALPVVGLNLECRIPDSRLDYPHWALEESKRSDRKWLLSGSL